MSYTPAPLAVTLALGRALTAAVGFTLALGGATPVGDADANVSAVAALPVVRATADVFAPLSTLSQQLSWRRTAAAWQTSAVLPWAFSEQFSSAALVPWERTAATQLIAQAAWRYSATVQNEAVLSWARTVPVEHTYTAPWRGLAARSYAVTFAWGDLQQLAKALHTPWRAAPANRLFSALLWRSTPAHQYSAALPWLHPPARAAEPALPWEPGAQITVYASTNFAPTPPVFEPPFTPAPVRSHACLNLRRSLDTATTVTLNLNKRLDSYICLGGTLFVENTLSVITLADGLPLEVTSLRMQLDVGSNAWSVDLESPLLSVYNRVAPTVAGLREIQVTLNGYVWRFVIESVGRSNKFNQQRYSAAGRSLTAYAAEPFEPLRSGVNATAKLAQQLANDALPPALAADFTIDWQALDWIVAAGALRYTDKDPLSVLAQLATSVGAVLVPDRSAKKFTVKSRYPVSPWLWPAELPGAQLLGEHQLELSARYIPAPAYNKVYVAGTTQLVGVKRAGTAGDRLMAQVIEPLLSTTPAAAERARAELGKAGNRADVQLLAPLVAANIVGPRLQELLTLVEVMEPDNSSSWRGLLTGVQVNVSRELNGPLVVAQQMNLERYYG